MPSLLTTGGGVHEPSEVQRSNWVPARKGADFSLYVRSYWPKVEPSSLPSPANAARGEQGRRGISLHVDGERSVGIVFQRLGLGSDRI